jgi:DNA end-binding protein Ku
LIEVVEFVPLAKVDREYLEKAYYLGPDKGGERAYTLLCEALKVTGRAALGQYSARGQQYLALLRPSNSCLVMEQLHYADEVRSPSDIAIPACELKPAELALAKQLIDQTATETFEPTKYKDTVRVRVIEAIERKIAGEPITADAPPTNTGQVIDLLAALQASLAKAS